MLNLTAAINKPPIKSTTWFNCLVALLKLGIILFYFLLLITFIKPTTAAPILEINSPNKFALLPPVSLKQMALIPSKTQGSAFFSHKNNHPCLKFGIEGQTPTNEERQLCFSDGRLSTWINLLYFLLFPLRLLLQYGAH